MGLPVRRIRLRRGERRRLERLVNKRTTPQRVVERANIVLCSAEGRSGSAICREVGVSRPTVTQWLDRYEAGGVEELLEDRPRSGRPRKITPDDEAEIVRKTLEEKPADATHWSCRLTWPRKRASIRPPSRGSGGLMDYSPTASSTGLPLHNPSSPRSAKRKRLWLHSTSHCRSMFRHGLCGRRRGGRSLGGNPRDLTGCGGRRRVQYPRHRGESSGRLPPDGDRDDR